MAVATQSRSRPQHYAFTNIEILIQSGALYWKDFNAPVVIFL